MTVWEDFAKIFIANLSQVVKKLSVFSVKSCKLREIAYILMSIIGKNERLVLIWQSSFYFTAGTVASVTRLFSKQNGVNHFSCTSWRQLVNGLAFCLHN